MVDNTITAPVEQHNTPEQPQPKPKQKKSWLKRILLITLLLMMILIGALTWLLSTQSGLHFAAFRIPTWFGVHISADKLEGTVLQGFNAKQLNVKMEGLDIRSESLNFDWQSKELLQRKLHIKELAVGSTHIKTSPTAPKPESPPATLPDSVGLPLQVAIDDLYLGKLYLEEDTEPVLLGTSIRYQYADDKHQLQLVSLDTGWSQLSGDIGLANETPFALSGQLQGNGVVEGTPITSTVNLSGNLEKPVLDAHIDGENIALEANAAIAPFETLLNEKIIALRLTGSHINPQAFTPHAPHAEMSLALLLQPVEGTDQLNGIITVANILPGFVDEDAIPIKTVFGDLSVNEKGILSISDLNITTLQDGLIDAKGQIDSNQNTLDIDVNLNQLTLADFINNSIKNKLSGNIHLAGEISSPLVNWRLDANPLSTEGKLSIDTDKENGQQVLNITETHIGTGKDGRIELSGFLNLFKEQSFDFKLNSKNINPNNIGSDFPVGNINGDINVNGQLAENFKINALLNIPSSRLSGVNLQGKGQLIIDDQHLEKADLNLLLGPNKFNTQGSFGLAKDRLNIDINAPQLNYFGFGLSGALKAKGFLAGQPEKLKIDLQGNANSLQFQKLLRLNQLNFNLLASPDLKAPLNIDIKGNNLAILSDDGNTIIDNIALTAKGSGANHRLASQANMSLDNKPYRLNLAAQGGLDDKNQWKGSVSTLDVAGAFNIKLRNTMRLEAGAEKVSMSQANWGLMGGQLSLQSFLWSAKDGIKTKGNASGLAVEQLNSLVEIPIEQNLVLAANWDLSYGNTMSGHLHVNRQSGDVVIPYRDQKLGLSKLDLMTRFQNGRINNQLDLNTTYGTGQVQLAIAQNFGNDITKAPLNGRILLNVDDLKRLRYFMPVGMDVQGKLNANIAIGGSVSNPQLNGPLNGDNLRFREQTQGVLLADGTLRSRLVGQKWVVDGLMFKRNAGSAVIKGEVDLSRAQPDVDLALVLNQFDLFSQPNRRLILSGQTKLTYTNLQSLNLDGALKVDDGLFDFPKSTMPSLDDDVVVIGRTQEEEESKPTLLKMRLTVDLNDRFRFKGQGLDILMGGKLLLTAEPHADLLANGQIKIVKGNFKAYGQDLVIEKGVVSFLGPLDNPALNFRAVRNNSPVGAGVEVRGSLNKPETILVADEPMSDKDKLSWLVLGRAASGGESDNSALAAAAGTWLASDLNDKIGLFDDLGFGSRQTRNNQTGELNPAEQMITVGKHLTNELYIGYEYGLTTADSAMKVIYQLSKSIQAIARVGTRSSDGEIRYTIRFD